MAAARNANGRSDMTETSPERLVSIWPAAGRVARASGSEIEPAGDLLADGQRRREAGTLDAKQGHQTRQAVQVVAIDPEVRLRVVRPVQLGADAGVVGRQRVFRHARPELAD